MILLAYYERFVVSVQLQEDIHQVKPSRSKNLHRVLQHEGDFPAWLPMQNCHGTPRMNLIDERLHFF
jgi:hypothetical protein